MNGPRLSALETSYLYAERPGYPLHVGSVATFEAAPLLDAGGRLRLDEIRDLVASRLDLLPQLRRRIAWTPLGLDRPSWVDDVDFDIANHVEVVEAPAPGDDRALREVATHTWLQLLDRAHPLWHLLFVTGLDGGRVGLVQRAHHALVDGVSGVDVAAVLLDVTPETRRQPPSTWRPSAPEPAPVALVRGLSRRAGDLAAVAGGASAALIHPSRLAADARRIAEVVTSLRTDGLVPRSSLNVPTGAGRRLAWVRTHLADVKAAGTDTGATANDVVLTAVAGGVRTALLARGEVVAHEQTISVLVPVSVRRPDERGALGNRVSALVLSLPIGLGDPAARLDATMKTMRRLKAEHGAEASETLVGALDLLPPVAIRLFAPVVHRQPLINLVVTNVPGSAAPLYMLGAQMLEVFPIVPLVGNLSVGVAVLSYDGALNLGLTADTATCADLDVLIGGIERCFRDLGAMSAVPAPVSAP